MDPIYLFNVRYDTDYESLDKMDYYLNHGSYNLPIINPWMVLLGIAAGLVSLYVLDKIQKVNNRIISRIARLLFATILVVMIFSVPPLLFSISC